MTTYTAQAESRKLRLNLYGNIGSGGMLGNGITSSWVADQIEAAGEIDQIDVHINSMGGDVFEGIGIYNELDQFPGQVNVYVMGVAASIASIIAMAGDQRIMYDGSEIMIHRAASFTFGTSEDHRRQSNLLAKFDKKLADIYANRSGSDYEEIVGLMTDETWMNADQALAGGYVTHLAPNEAEAPVEVTLVNRYQNVPKNVAAWAGQTNGVTNLPITETTTMATNEMKEEEVATQAVAEVADQDVQQAAQTVEALKAQHEELMAQVAAIEAQLAELAGGTEEAVEVAEEEVAQAEEVPIEDAPAIARAFAHDQAFACKMIAEGVSLAESHRRYNDHAQQVIADLRGKVEAAEDGVAAVNTAARATADANSKTITHFKRAKKLNAQAREPYLNGVGIDISDYENWEAANG